MTSSPTSTLPFSRRSISEVQKAIADVGEIVKHSGKSVEGIVQRLEGRLTGLENTLKSKVAELERSLQETHKVLTDPHSVANSKFQTLVKLNQEHTEQLKRIEAALDSASAASSGWLFPTLVCGQMLALAAFLFYRQVVKDKKRDHFL